MIDAVTPASPSYPDAGGSGSQAQKKLGATADPDLSALLDRAAAGDVEAAAAVYDRVSVFAYHLVLLVVGDVEVATEVCRQAFGAVWEGWGATPDHARRRHPVQTWLLMTVHRFATDHCRATGLPRTA